MPFRVPVVKLAGDALVPTRFNVPAPESSVLPAPMVMPVTELGVVEVLPFPMMLKLPVVAPEELSVTAVPNKTPSPAPTTLVPIAAPVGAKGPLLVDERLPPPMTKAPPLVKMRLLLPTLTFPPAAKSVLLDQSTTFKAFDVEERVVPVPKTMLPVDLSVKVADAPAFLTKETEGETVMSPPLTELTTLVPAFKLVT